ncbi:hypothetical protein ACFQ3Z_14395 [Streptomyces nogalater]
MYSRLVALRIRPAGYENREADGPDLPVHRLVAEWSANQPEPVEFWLSFRTLRHITRSAKGSAP